MLDEGAIQKLRLVLAGDGWNHVMKPALQRRLQTAVKALCLSRSERAVQFKASEFDSDDEECRAIIRECERMLVVWDNEVLVFDQNRRNDELVARNQ